eukprot:1175500-Prorocentrum_minimum.AAC.1
MVTASYTSIGLSSIPSRSPAHTHPVVSPATRHRTAAPCGQHSARHVLKAAGVARRRATRPGGRQRRRRCAARRGRQRAAEAFVCVCVCVFVWVRYTHRAAPRGPRCAWRRGQAPPRGRSCPRRRSR